MARKELRVDVSPEVLRWARESAGVSLEQTAKRLGTSVHTVRDWESAAKQPTLKALETLAVFYRRPLAAFLLPEPPAEAPLPTDFRVLPGARGKPLSRKTRLAVREARRLQTRTEELAKELGVTLATQLPKASLRADPEKVAAAERARIGVTIQEQMSWNSPYTALERWRECLESLNILVFQMRMPLEDVRAFSLSGKRIRTIVLSTSDAASGRIFSLFHEYAHILLDKAGLCIPSEYGAERSHASPVEVFCDRFAAAFLVPADALMQEIDTSVRPGEDVPRLLRRFGVSRRVIWRRMLSTKVVGQAAYWDKVNEWEREHGKPPRGRAPKPPKRCLRDRGPKFAELVLQGVDRNTMTHSEALDYLGIRMKHLDEVRALVRDRK